MQTANPPSADVLLEASDVCKSFHGVCALDKAQLVVRRGRCLALLGENGAGKSTLMNILAGVLRADSGEIRLDGQVVSFSTPRRAQEAGISTVFQELSLAPNLTVAENIFLGREPRNRWGLIDYDKLNADARSLLDQLHLSIDPRTAVSRLKIGLQQMVEIARALSFDARVLILDEPTSSLADQEVQSLLEVIRRLKQRGVAIVYITHRLDELAHVADDVTVLRDGRHVATRPYCDTSRDEMITLMVGRELARLFERPALTPGKEMLTVAGLSLRQLDRGDEYAVRNVSFVVRQREIVGVFGLLGAGRTELLETLFGVHAARMTGSVCIDGARTVIRRPEDAIRAGAALVPEDRKGAGLVLSMSVLHNAAMSILGRIVSCGLINSAKERSLVTRFVQRLHIKTASLRSLVGTLSGGNQQKTVLAKWLATEPKILLLDEPTRGIDVGARQELYSLISGLAADGMAILLASSELPELLGLADRILVMAEGRLTAEFDRADASEEKLLRAALPASRVSGGHAA